MSDVERATQVGAAALYVTDKLRKETAREFAEIVITAALPYLTAAAPQGGVSGYAQIAFDRAAVLRKVAASMDAQERRDRRDDEDLSRMADDMTRLADLAAEIGNAILAASPLPHPREGIEG